MDTIGFIDPYPVVRAGFSTFLKELGQHNECLISSDPTSFARQHKGADLKLLFLSINSEDSQKSLTLMECSKNLFPLVPIVVFDETYALDLLVRYFKIGIKGYLLKSDPGIHIKQCIQTVLAGSGYLSPSCWQTFMDELTGKTNERVVRGRRTHTVVSGAPLTNREFEIATLLSKGEKTNSIACQLRLLPSAVSTSKRKILSKLNISNIIQLRDIMDVEPKGPQTQRKTGSKGTAA
jgi:DNA-binding NarL/FixJ family response regulator